MGSAPIQASIRRGIAHVGCGSVLGLILIKPRLVARLTPERCLSGAMGRVSCLSVFTYLPALTSYLVVFPEYCFSGAAGAGSLLTYSYLITRLITRVNYLRYLVGAIRLPIILLSSPRPLANIVWNSSQ